MGAGIATIIGVGIANSPAKASPMPARTSPPIVQVVNASPGVVPVSGQAPSPPKPTQGPVRYGGTGGQGIFGPFYLEFGIQRVQYSFRVDGTRLPGRDPTRYYFQALLVGSKGSDFTPKTIVMSSKDNLDDFNNIEVPAGNYYLQIFDSEGAWQIDIGPSGSFVPAAPLATSTPNPSAAPTVVTSQLATISQFNNVSVGMTYEQVVSVMGSAGAKTHEFSTSLSVYTTYEWKMSGCTTSAGEGKVEFKDGKVSGSSQYCQ